MRLSIPLLATALLAAGAAPGHPAAPRVEQARWPDGTLRLEATYRGSVLHGPYRSWYRDGRPYQFRHYARGREEGRQQAWTPEGELYINYDVWNGRRYGYVNAQPCLPVVGGEGAAR